MFIAVILSLSGVLEKAEFVSIVPAALPYQCYQQKSLFLVL